MCFLLKYCSWHRKQFHSKGFKNLFKNLKYNISFSALITCCIFIMILLLHFLMFLKEVFYDQQSCIYLTKESNIVKYVF